LRGAECVKKSYPHFWGDFKKLGGDFDVIDWTSEN
jgi:5-enolpyruvylshikimate-3-phosphate synthase